MNEVLEAMKLIVNLNVILIVIAGTILSTTYLFLDVITLNDANFEEKTQMTTGATTGRWFVKFYAPVRTILLIDM